MKNRFLWLLVFTFMISLSYGQEKYVIRGEFPDSLSTDGCMQQPLWQKNLENMKGNCVSQIAGGDLNRLKLTDYVCKGRMKSEKEKSVVIEAMFSDKAPIAYVVSDVLVGDTVVTTTDSIIHQKRNPNIEILTVGRMKEIEKLTEASVLMMKQRFEKSVAIGTEYVELVWDYKGKEYRSIGIVSNDGFPDNLITAGLRMGGCTIVKGISKK